MDVWQLNAKYAAWEYQNTDKLSLLLQAAYLGAYWNNSGRKGKSLKGVLKSIAPKNDHPRKKIDKEKVARQFEQFEELRNRGWTKV